MLKRLPLTERFDRKLTSRNSFACAACARACVFSRSRAERVSFSSRSKAFFFAAFGAVLTESRRARSRWLSPAWDAEMSEPALSNSVPYPPPPSWNSMRSRLTTIFVTITCCPILSATVKSLVRSATSRNDTGMASWGYTSTPRLVPGMSSLTVTVLPSNAVRRAYSP